MEAGLHSDGAGAVRLPAAVAGTISANALHGGRTFSVADGAKELGTTGAFTCKQN